LRWRLFEVVFSRKVNVPELKLIGVVWAAWFIGWLLAGLGSAKTVARQSRVSRLLYTMILAAGAILIMPREHARGRVEQLLFTPHLALPWFGLALVLGGLALTVWARWHLGRFWSGTVTLKAGHRVVRSGPYGMTRHPIYTGLLIAILGTAVAVGTLGSAFGIILFVLGIWVKIRLEEELLTAHFGTDYEAYRQEVPALIPGL
jgi:protein-S-isoprenylcysteine O-methyltransferase Ste14